MPNYLLGSTKRNIPFLEDLKLDPVPLHKALQGPGLSIEAELEALIEG